MAPHGESVLPGLVDTADVGIYRFWIWYPFCGYSQGGNGVVVKDVLAVWALARQRRTHQP